MRMHHFGAQNSPFAPNKTLFWKISFSFTYWPFLFFSNSVNKHCSFYSCLSTCQKSKSNMNLLRKHWRLKILKSHWLRAILGYNLRTRFFPSMQFSQNVKEPKNFRFTQIPGKTNNMIFLKRPKNLFLGHFWPFLVIFAWWEFFPKNPALSHTTIYGPLKPC